MTGKRFKLDDFDSENEMWELLNIQAEVISDLEKENKQLKQQINELIKGIQETSKMSADAVTKQWRSEI